MLVKIILGFAIYISFVIWFVNTLKNAPKWDDESNDDIDHEVRMNHWYH